MSSQSSNYPASSTASVPAPSSAASDVERIETLQRIEKEISELLIHASKTMEELTHVCPVADYIQKTSKDFLNSLEFVEQGLSHQIAYLSRVSTMHSHEGSNYGAEKDYELLTLQTALARERIQKLLS